MKDIEKYIKHF